MWGYSSSVKSKRFKRKRLDSRFGGNDRRNKNYEIIRGILSVNSRAVGFIEDEKQGEDIRIETENLNTALNRDEVEVKLLRERVRNQHTGRVIRIIKRAKMRFVGTIEERTSLHAAPTTPSRRLDTPPRAGGDGGAPFSKGDLRHRLVLVPDDFRMYAPIAIPQPPRDAQKGFKALAEIKEWQNGKRTKNRISGARHAGA